MASINQHELASSNVYRLLARLWVRELTDLEVIELRRPALAAALAPFGMTSPVSEPAELDRLAADYCQLFVGPKGHRPPVQSVWCEGQFQGQAAASMRRYAELFTDAAGLWRDANPLDHLGVQLDAMGLVMFELSRGEGSQRSELRQLASSFHQDHLAWTEPLTRWVAERAETSFYGGLAEATRQLLESEGRREPHDQPV